MALLTKPANAKEPTTPTKKGTARQYTAADLAKEVGLKNASLARRYLRVAKVQRPKAGWTWPDKAAAKSAIEAVQRAAKDAKS